MKTKIKLLSIIALLASTMFIQACGPAINFTPLTKEEVKKLDDAGKKWTKEARDLIQKFGFEQVDMKAVSLAFVKRDLVDANDKKAIDEKVKVRNAIEAKKDSKEVVGLITDKDDFMNKNIAGIDDEEEDNTPKSVYLLALKEIASAGALISKTTLADELVRVESKADVKFVEQEIKADASIITELYKAIYAKLK